MSGLKSSTQLKISCIILTVAFLPVFAPDAFSLTPMVDLSGKWSGSAKMQDVDGYCSFTGIVTAILQQSGDSITGQYEFAITNSKSTGKIESMVCSSDSSSRGSLSGNVDGTVVTMVDSQGIRISGTATNDLLILDFADSYVIGTVKMQKFADFSKPSKSQPSTVPQMIDVGVSYLNEQRFDKALESFNKIIGKEPNNIMGWMGKGVSLVGLKKYDQAITHFKKSLEISPGNKDALQWLARSYYLNGDCKSASNYAASALISDPNNAKMLAEKKIMDSCLAKQAEAKAPNVILDKHGNQIKKIPENPAKHPNAILDQFGKPLKTDSNPEGLAPKTGPVTLEIRNKFRDCVVAAFGSDPQIRKYVDGITVISRDSHNFDTPKTFSDLDVTAAVNTKEQREKLEENKMLNKEKLAKIDDAKSAIRKMWTAAEKCFKSKTDKTFEQAEIYVYDEYGGRSFNAPNKPEGYKRAEAVRIMLGIEKFSVIPLQFDEKTGKSSAGKILTTTPIGTLIDMHDVREYAQEFLEKIAKDKKDGKPLNLKYVEKLANAIDKVVENQRILGVPEEKLQYLTASEKALVLSVREGKSVDPTKAQEFIKRISTLN